MADINVSIHELKARLSEFLGRSIHGKERIIITRRDHPIAMIVPLEDDSAGRGKGLADVDWSAFAEVAEFVEQAYTARQDDGHREIPF